LAISLARGLLTGGAGIARIGGGGGGGGGAVVRMGREVRGALGSADLRTILHTRMNFFAFLAWFSRVGP
tara:strand:+ start:215 stop:421 length:207 start_codon:yes stop_codon:yes gene_type:complete